MGISRRGFVGSAAGLLTAAVSVTAFAWLAQGEDLSSLVKEDLRHEVRPGGVNGSPFWNTNARFFMYPPAFDFPADKAAKAYRFEVVDAKGAMHVFTAKVPTASLAPVWEELPSGWTSESWGHTLCLWG